jgi:hypothetical protein
MTSDTVHTLDDLPQSFSGPSAWTGKGMRQQPERWLYTLTADDIADLENAASHFQKLQRDVGTISRETFPLRCFDQHLDLLKEKLLNGVGVEVLRGLPISNYTQRFAGTIFCGIGAHLGSARSQNADGHILGHVRDVGADADAPDSRIYQTNARQTFHTDSADVVGLLCVQKAQQGGESLLVSAESIYNVMRKQYPNLLLKLFDPIATDRRGEIPPGAAPYMNIPVLNWYEGFMTVFYQRQYIDSAQRYPGALRLTDQHIEALDQFDQLADDPELHFSMQLEPGDMQFVYNHSQMHDRTAFIDWPDPVKRRHLMRLWLSVEGDRPLPECFRERYGCIAIGDRGGIVTEKTRLHAPLE